MDKGNKVGWDSLNVSVDEGGRESECVVCVTHRKTGEKIGIERENMVGRFLGAVTMSKHRTLFLNAFFYCKLEI